jgi:hypothetical protein
VRPSDPELVRVGSHGRLLRVGVTAVALLLTMAILKPWPNPAPGPRPGAASSGSAVPSQLVARATATPRSPASPTHASTTLCENPDAWRVVAEDIEFGQHVRTWVIASVAYSSSPPVLSAVPVTALVSSGVESLGFCAPAAGTGTAGAGATGSGWSGTVWRVGADASDSSQWELVGRLDASPGSLGGFSEPVDPTSVFWQPGRYVMEAQFGGVGTPAWLGVLIQSSF